VAKEYVLIVGLCSLLDFLNLPDTYSHIKALGLTQPVIELRIRNVPGNVKRGQRVRLTTLPPSVSRLPRKCGSLDISQLCVPQWPVTGIALLVASYCLS
jgi:hypothetical protein